MSADSKSTCPKCSNLPEHCTCDALSASAETMDDQDIIDSREGFPAAADDPALKELESRFKVIEKLGSGSNSTVYLVEHLTLAKRVALKILHRRKSESVSSIKRFEREARTLSDLKHPGFVEIHDLGVTSDGSLYIVMEYADGVSLKRHFTEHGAIDPDRVVRLFCPLLDALQYAHDHGVVHRDIKPENIILARTWNNEEVIRLVDFGVAWQEFEGGEIQRLTRTGRMIGTPGYLSPEQIHGQALDARSDIYSLGCVLYEALAGQCAFRVSNVMETLNRQLESEPRSLFEVCSIDKELSDAIHSCLCKDLDSRPVSAKDLKRQILEASKSRYKPGAAVRQILRGAAVFLLGAGLSYLFFGHRGQVEPAEEKVAATESGETATHPAESLSKPDVKSSQSADIRQAEAKIMIDLAHAEITSFTTTRSSAEKIYGKRFAKAMSKEASRTERLACTVFAILPIVSARDFDEARNLFSKVEPDIKATIASGSYDNLDSLFSAYILILYGNMYVREAIDMDRVQARKELETVKRYYEQAILLSKARADKDSGSILGTAYTGVGIIYGFNKDLKKARQNYKLAFDWRLKTKELDSFSTMESLTLLVKTSIELSKRSRKAGDIKEREAYLNTASEALKKVMPAYKKTDKRIAEILVLRNELAKEMAE